MNPHTKPHQIIKRPVLTEKYSPVEFNGKQRVSFQVAQSATKTQIRQAVQELYAENNIVIDSIRTSKMKGKPRLTRQGWGRTKDWKKAVVTLKSGTIDFV